MRTPSNVSGQRERWRFDNLVGVRGFEPPAPASRTQCSTRLSYTPAKVRRIAAGPRLRKKPLDDTASNHLLW